jgi:hypothetical protein
VKRRTRPARKITERRGRPFRLTSPFGGTHLMYAQHGSGLSALRVPLIPEYSMLASACQAVSCPGSPALAVSTLSVPVASDRVDSSA